MKKNILDDRITILLRLILTILYYPKSLELALRPQVMNTIKKLD